MDAVTLLSNIPLFESLAPEDLQTLALKLDPRTVAAGEVVFNQGDAGEAMYVIQSGAIEISVGTGKSRVVLATLFEGQYFGELTLFDGAPRSATATAAKDTVLLDLGRDDIRDFVMKNPAAALRIMQEIAERMRATNELMSRQVSKNVLAEEEERLSFGDRVADKVASFGGSWPFIFFFSAVMISWMTWNSLFHSYAFDPLPFMFLNLVLSTVAALQAPVIMMSQNRQAAKDKALAVNGFQVNLKNEIGIDTLVKGQAELLQRVALVERRLSGPRVSGPVPVQGSGTPS
jgi:uncharacterized membrane protein